MKVDLHLHTTASDGTWSNETLLDKVVQNKIKVFSITDHNSVENAVKMTEVCAGSDIIFIPGVEISCYHRQTEYHVTAYGFDPASTGLKRVMDLNQEAMESVNDGIVSYASSITGKVSVDQYRLYENDRTRGGCKAFNFLFDAGVVTCWEEFFQYYLGSGVKPVLPEAHEVIETVKKAGGRPILAHPSVYHEGVRMAEEELAEWVELGITGLECYHPSTINKPDTAFYADFCSRNDLMITGGSDCHGEFVPSRFIGRPEITIDMIRTDFINDFTLYT